MNIFKGTLRYLEHLGRMRKFSHDEPVLDPRRMVNRTLYGTDYHPEDVAFQLTKALKHFHTEMNGVSIQEYGKCLADEMVHGFGILEHAWVDGRLTVKAVRPENYIG
jgi:hypothetical protein